MPLHGLIHVEAFTFVDFLFILVFVISGVNFADLLVNLMLFEAI